MGLSSTDLIDLLPKVSPSLAAAMDQGLHSTNHADREDGHAGDRDCRADHNGEGEADDDHSFHQDSLVRAQVSSATLRCWTSSTWPRA